MNPVFTLSPKAVAFDQASGKRTALARIAALFASSYDLDREQVLEALEEREALGSTGFGHGVAIPHTRLDGLARPVAAVLRLEAPIDFAAADAMPVELVFGLLSPSDGGAAHLHALAAISRQAREDASLARLLDAPGPEALYALLAEGEDARDAA